MKAIKKNGYLIITIAFFVISLAILVLFVALFSESTAVDSTTVGNIYIGDISDETKKRQTLTNGVNTWKEEALYTISFQGVDVVIGRTNQVDENNQNKVDEDGNLLYNYKGLEFLTFDYDSTMSHLAANSSNIAYYTIDETKKQAFYNVLVANYGTTVCDDNALEFDILVRDIQVAAREMTTIVDFNLYDYLKESFTNTTVTSIPLTNLNSETVDQLAELFDGERIELLPQELTKNKLGFSAIEYFSNGKFSDLTSAEMSIIATGLAAVVQETSFTVTVKNQGYVSDRYYAYDGMTARINIKDGTDLRIINPEDSSYYVSIVKTYDCDNELKFILTGCLFMVEYTVVKTSTTIPYAIEYAAKESSFTYDGSNKLMGNDTEKGCYYLIETPGDSTVLYAYTKVTTYLNGTTSTTEVYPKQEYCEGTTEYRSWTTLNYPTE